MLPVDTCGYLKTTEQKWRGWTCHDQSGCRCESVKPFRGEFVTENDGTCDPRNISMMFWLRVCVEKLDVIDLMAFFVT